GRGGPSTIRRHAGRHPMAAAGGVRVTEGRGRTAAPGRLSGDRVVKAVLLTGATGFVGGHVARALAAAGWQVRAITRPTSDTAGLADLGDRITFHDLGPSPAALFTGIQAVVHVATNYGRNDVPSTLAADNTLFPLRLLEWAVAAHVPVFVN